MTRRLALTGLAVLASFALTTACTKGTPGASTTTPVKSAADQLKEAAAKTKGQTFKYTVAYGDTIKGDGALDSTGKSSESNMTVSVADAGLTVKINTLIVDGDIFLRLDLGPLTATIPGLKDLGTKWMHVDKAKIGNSGLVAQFTPSEESVGASAFVAGVVSAEKVSDTEYKGTIDLTKSAPGVLQDDQISGYGDAAKAIPFTATLDSQGRIIKLVLTMPKTATLPAADLTSTYTDFGVALPIAKPAASDVVEAPDLIYTFLQ
jgi:hypothetical protein